MIFFMISCFSFILLSKFSLNTLPFSSLAWFGRELSHFFMSWLEKTMIPITSSQLSTITPSVNEPACLKAEKIISSFEEEEKISLLDLPELALEYILERLSPPGLCSMSRVCTSLRDRCASDHFWERHMKQKWGRLIGDVAYREWQWHIAKRKRSSILSKDTKHNALFGYVSLLWNRSKFITCIEPCSTLPVDSVMAWYLALETGKFWFPAQVYNRENGNVGFVLSCYDAELSYNSITNTFKARYSSPHGRRTIEENIEWDRLRAPAVDTPAHVLHTSDCLDDLKPGNHIEIQWRRNKEFPYGWWYGVVGHMELCDGNKIHCQCHSSDTVILEFKQYTPGSQWRQTAINRKDHREVGNEADGFYGGIRKLYHKEEIWVWKRLWPTQVLE